MSGTPFDPKHHVRRLRLNGQVVDYLDVKWRLVWLRAEHPDAQVTTEHVQISADVAVFRATATIPGRGAATGYGSARSAEHANHVEQAETAALGRALAALGYGAEYAPDFVLAAEEAPTEATPAVADPAPAQPAAQAPAQPAGLPAGVTVGPGGGRSLPPRLAAVFAQAKPIVEEPEPEPTPAIATTPSPANVDDPRPEAAAPVASSEEPAPTAEAAPAARADTPTTQAPRVTPRPAEPTALPTRSDVTPPGGTRPPAPRPAASASGAGASPTVRRVEPPARTPPGLASRDPARLAERPRSFEPAAAPTPTAPSRSTRRAPVDEDADDAADADGLDDSQADHDWSAFWPWARGKGYFNRDDVEKAIGQSIKGRTPRELRTLIMNLDA